MPTQMAVEISILRIGLQLMHVAHVVVAMIHLLQSLETPQLMRVKREEMNARMVMESTHSVMVATGMMPTQMAVVDTIPLTSPPPNNAVPVEEVLKMYLSLQMTMVARTAMELTHSVMAATGMMPTQVDAVDTIPLTSLPPNNAVPVEAALEEMTRVRMMKKMTARTVMESTRSVMAATGMMQTQVDAVFTIQMTSPPPTNAVPVEAVLVEMTKVRMMKRMNARMVKESTHSVMDATGMMPIQVHVEFSILLISSLMMNAVYANE